MESLFRWYWKCSWICSNTLAVGFFRELLGSGTLFGIPVLGDPIEKTGLYSIGYENNGFMLMPPMALIIVGLIIWVQRSRNTTLIED